MLSTPLRPGATAVADVPQVPERHVARRPFDVLDTDGESVDALVKAAAAACRVPFALISVIDAERLGFKTQPGWPGAPDAPQDRGFCTHAMLGETVLEIPDASQDKRFSAHPLLTAAPRLRFYAGLPLQRGDGTAIGTLCVFDTQPRQLDDGQRQVLQHLARGVSQMLEERVAQRAQAQAHEYQYQQQHLAARLQELSQIVDAVPSMLGYLDRDLSFRFANRACQQWLGIDPQALVGMHVATLLGHERYALNQPYFEAVLNGVAQTFESVVVGPNGRTRRALANFMPDVVDGVVLGFTVEVNDVTLLREAEVRAATLANERDRLAMVARNTVNAVIVTDTERRITWVNAGFERISGYSAAEVLGRTPSELLNFEDTDPATLQRLAAAGQAGEGFVGELLNRGKHGRIYWSAIEIQPLHDDGGALTGFMGIESDITERVKAAAALRASRRLLDKTGRIGGVGGWMLDLDTQAIELTEQAFRIVDWQPDHRPTLAECLALIQAHPQARAKIQEAIEQARTGTPTWDFEQPLLTATGRHIWVRFVAVTETEPGNASGSGKRLIGVLQDITQRRQIEAQARRNLQLLHGAIQAIDDSFVIYDPEDRLVFCNDTYRSLVSGLADVLVPGAHFADILREGVRRGLFPAAHGREEAWIAEVVAAHRTGSQPSTQNLPDGRCLRVVDRVLADGHLVSFRSDITDLVRATEAAQESSRAKSDFIATMSHELRTPLQSINGYAELGQHMARTEAQAGFDSMFGVVLGAGKRMLSLVNDLLDLSAIDAVTLTVTRQPEDLRLLVHQVCEELQALAGARQVRFEGLPGLPALPVLADAGRMQQVVRNVLANAIRFAPAGSAVHIAGEDGGHRGITLVVRDHGPGIPPDELESIFGAFVQSSRTRDGSGGSGLGLAICRRIMTAHGGTITADNALPAGAVLHLRLPPASAACHALGPDPGMANPIPNAALSA